ncbi:putative integrase core domain protein [Trichinella spiralis]|uniref:putative integrase core domain protein n=1 Tax=Trichinella spiralis TaxID=6334 RepID=UPI0001EFD3BF|nr:putative integrase core domain protein [Trichinella spiralis]
MAAVPLASNEGAEPLEAPQDENIECVIRYLRRGRRPTDSEWRELHKDSRDLVKQWKHLRLTPTGLAVVVTGNPARWVPPNHARPSILEQIHNVIGGGHLGVKKTAEKVRTRYFWPGWYRDVKAWCNRCEACAPRKTPPIVNRAPMESIVHIMVVTDYFTRWVEPYALPNQQAETVARKLVQQFVCRFGTPMKLLSDQGTQFQGRLVTELCKLLGIEKIRTTAYHPQCNGMVERFNRTLAMMLTTAMEEAQDDDWETRIPQVCFAYNASVHETTGYAPFEIMFGRPPRLPVDAAFNTNMGKEMTTSKYVEELAAHLRNAVAAARKHSAEEQKRQRYYYNRKAGNMNYQTHEADWLYCHVNKGKRNRKFATPWTGPVEIIEQVSGVNYRIRSIGSPDEPSWCTSIA